MVNAYFKLLGTVGSILFLLLAASYLDLRLPVSLTQGVALAAPVNEGVKTSAKPHLETQRWDSQTQYLETLSSTANALRKDTNDIIRTLEAIVPFYDEELLRLLVLSDTYENIPRVLEAVDINIKNVGEIVKTIMEPALDNREAAEDLLYRIVQMEKALPADLTQTEKTPPNLSRHFQTIEKVKSSLNENVAVLNSALGPSKALLIKITEASANIEKILPELWQQQYFAPPLSQTYVELWSGMGLKLEEMGNNFALRINMELPHNAREWKTVGTRFFTVLFFGFALTVLLRLRILKRQRENTVANLLPASTFYGCVPWLLLGAALVAGATASTQVYQALLALGNLLLVVGQVSLAWALRHTRKENCPKFSPLWPLCATTIVGYLLLYPALPVALLALIWSIALVGALIWQRFHRKDIPLQLEKSILQLNTIMLWLSLFLLVLGLPYYAILLYILFTSLAVALQLSLGGMQTLHKVAQSLPTEGFKAILGSVWLACVAPVMLVLVALGVALWTITLPGGYSLLHKYALAGIDVGETHFNILQLLLIISAFYIARTLVHIGKSLLEKMPERGIKLDSSLIQPLQTGLTYGVWTLFGLFTLKALGMELSNLAVVAGGLSVGIGFGMQAIVNNFLSGLILIFSRILQVGDVVEVGGLLGTVRKISVRATTVETMDNAVIYVPNSEFVSSHLINWTRNGRSVRREITVGVAYGTNTDKVIELLGEAAKANHNVLKYPEPSIVFSNFGNSTLDFVLRFWVHDFNVATSAASALRQDIEKLFRQHHIEVAFPQLDVHIKNMPPPHPTSQLESYKPNTAKARPRLRSRRLLVPGSRAFLK